MGLLRDIASSIADATVVFSYTQPGWVLRRAEFEPIDVDLRGQVHVLTGANAGLGRAAAAELLHRGATVVMACRSPERGRDARDLLALEHDAWDEPVGERAVLEIVDVSDPDACREFAQRVLAAHGRIDVLINNAGVLLDDRGENERGTELTFATNVLGGFVLTRAFADALARRDSLRPGPGRVVNVTSGGAYTQRLEVGDPLWQRRRFDGVAAYAETKRAQIVLTEMWADRLDPDVVVAAMHPGWADTPGVLRSLPRFHKLLEPILRTPAAGADSMVWLAAHPKADAMQGQLVFDRSARRTHLLSRTRASRAEREQLWALCDELATEDP